MGDGAKKNNQNGADWKKKEKGSPYHTGQGGTLTGRADEPEAKHCTPKKQRQKTCRERKKADGQPMSTENWESLEK